MSYKKIFIYFLVALSVDVINKNLYLAFSDAHTSEKVYWTGQSFTFLCYIVFIWIVSKKIYSLDQNKWTFFFKISALNWIAFAVNDLFDEVFGEASVFNLLEYVAFIITIGLTIREWKKYIRKIT